VAIDKQLKSLTTEVRAVDSLSKRLKTKVGLRPPGAQGRSLRSYVVARAGPCLHRTVVCSGRQGLGYWETGRQGLGPRKYLGTDGTLGRTVVSLYGLPVPSDGGPRCGWLSIGCAATGLGCLWSSGQLVGPVAVDCGLAGFRPGMVQAILVAKEVILGDRHDRDNVFRWDTVRMNLPGSEGYAPSLPWVSKIRFEDGCIAADLFIYVDDVRVTGNSKKECDAAARRAASVANGLGVQDAPRKMRFGARDAGAWAGSVVETNDQGVFVTVSQEKWDKSRRYIGDIIEELSRSKELCHKDLERKRGFLIYVTRTYPSMVPYLKGIHQTLETWRLNREPSGWKQKASRVKDPTTAALHAKGPPKFVRAAPRLAGDAEALRVLTSSERPPR
jgi:hypothetical protein